jgi:hypothetical protein
MVRLLDMLVHVLILGCVAAAYITADQAHTQIRPAVAQIHALLAYPYTGLFDLDLIQVRAGYFFQAAGESQFEEQLWDVKSGRDLGHGSNLPWVNLHGNLSYQSVPHFQG